MESTTLEEVKGNRPLVLAGKERRDCIYREKFGVADALPPNSKRKQIRYEFELLARVMYAMTVPNPCLTGYNGARTEALTQNSLELS